MKLEMLVVGIHRRRPVRLWKRAGGSYSLNYNFNIFCDFLDIEFVTVFIRDVPHHGKLSFSIAGKTFGRTGKPITFPISELLQESLAEIW